MIKLIEGRKLGIDPVWLLPKVCGSHRWSQTELSHAKEMTRAHPKGINTLCLDGNSSKYLLSGGTEGTIAVHDVTRPVGSSDHTCPVVTSVHGGISVVQWYPHDTGIFTTSSVDSTLRVWDTNEMCVVEQFKVQGAVYSHDMAAAQKHTLIAVGCKDSNITLCDMTSGSDTHVLRSHKKSVLCVRWCPSNEYVLASGSQDNRLFLWDIRKAKGPLLSFDQHNGKNRSSSSVVTAHTGYVSGMEFTSDGLFIVSTGTDNRLRLWDVFTGANMLINYGRILHDFKHQTHHITFTPPSISLAQLLFVPTKSDIVICDVFTGEQIKKLKGHYGRVNTCVCNKQEFELYSAGTDGNILVWAPLLPDMDSTERVVPSQVAIYQDAWSDED